MSKQFAVTSNHQPGCTFLDWSIHWLAGHDYYYTVDHGLVAITSNPIDGLTAHAHPKNHPLGLDQLIDQISKLNQYDGVSSVYFYYKLTYQVAEKLGIPQEQIVDHLQTSILDEIVKDYAVMWKYCNQSNIPIIFLKLTNNPLYTQSPRNLESQWTEKKIHTNADAYLDEFVATFFKDGLAQWSTKDIWDRREFIALNIRPYNNWAIDQAVDLSCDHLYVDAQELWYNGIDTLTRILNYLNIPLNTQRLLAWQPIYQQWQQQQLNILQFTWNLDHICDSIINNYNYDISKYKLDLWHEAIIQHVMLYKHNLNFKTWGLTKFPTNTQQLHSLLEPNTVHTLEDIYGLFK